MEAPEVPTEHLHEEIHHRATHGATRERWIMGAALTAALLAGLAAIASLKAGHFVNEAMMHQIDSANQWSYFQSKSIKESQLSSKIELLSALGKMASPKDEEKIIEYKKEKTEIEDKAKELSQEALHKFHAHEVMAKAVTLFQVAIAVGAISVLTSRKLFWIVSIAFGAIGIYYLMTAWA